MFILLVKYCQPLTEIDKALPAHIEYLDKYYALKKFICSGRQNPRVGGVILCTVTDRAEVEAIIQEDPFSSQQLANYEIVEFTPTKYADELQVLFA